MRPWLPALVALCAAAPVTLAHPKHAPAAPGGRDGDDDEDPSGTSALAPGERVERIAVGAGVTIPVLIAEPKQAPAAVVLLFAGGNGLLGLTDREIAHGADNFMVRTRGRFVAAGYVAVVVDVPSDHADGIGDERVAAGYGDELVKLAAWATTTWKRPIWLVGTSRGTLSAANAAARGASIAGLVLTSSITAGKKKVTLHDVALDRIKVPTLVLHDIDDGCRASPLAGARALPSALAKARVTFRTLDGGAKPASGPCAPLSPHGFYGLDEQAVAEIVGYLRRS